MKIPNAALAIFCLLPAPILLAQGNLAPTAAPGPLMKSLDQIEPRTQITSLPYLISTPGSYYFTKNLTFSDATGSAISIFTGGVTLDLGGFTLASTAAVTGRAIEIGSSQGIVIKNGFIAGNTTVAVAGTAPNQTWTVTPAGFDLGIFDFSTGSRFQDLSIRGCRSFGLFCTGGSNTVIERVTVFSNGIYGISSEFSSVANCVATSNGSIGIYAFSGAVANCSASFNGSTAIYANYGSVANTTATSNGQYGVYVENGCAANVMARTNGGTGIYAPFGSVTNSTSTSNGDNGIVADFGTVTNCTARSNSFIDLYATSAVVSFCKAGTTTISGALTGNLSP